MFYYSYMDDSLLRESEEEWKREEDEAWEDFRERYDLSDDDRAEWEAAEDREKWDLCRVLNDYCDSDRDPLSVYEDDPLDGADRLLAEMLRNAGAAGITEFCIEGKSDPRVIEDDSDRIRAVSKVFELQKEDACRDILIARLLFKRQIPEETVRRFCGDYFRPGTDYGQIFAEAE